jgi:hypothetical protein
LFLSANSADWKETLTPQYTEYALTNPYGAKQRTLHARGTKEISWDISGDLTRETSSLLFLLNPQWRGVSLNSLEIAQGSEGKRFVAINPYDIPWASVSFSGNQNGIVAYSLSGKSTVNPGLLSGTTKIGLAHPIPAWATGNNFVKSWTVSHNVPLSPNWQNNVNPLPQYYRPGPSQWTLNLTTIRVLVEHTIIRFTTGGFTLIEGIVTSRNFRSGDRNSGFSYEVTIENVRPDLEAYLPSATTVTIPIWPESLWPDQI